jgi:hypothetical protein
MLFSINYLTVKLEVMEITVSALLVGAVLLSATLFLYYTKLAPQK